jgi:hypothetical protein
MLPLYPVSSSTARIEPLNLVHDDQTIVMLIRGMVHLGRMFLLGHFDLFLKQESKALHDYSIQLLPKNLIIYERR